MAEPFSYKYRSRQLRPFRNLVTNKDQFLGVPVPAIDRQNMDLVAVALGGFHKPDGREEWTTQPLELIGQPLLILWISVRRRAENALERCHPLLALGHNPPQHLGNDPIRVPLRYFIADEIYTRRLNAR
jgi:hypothetical protein